MLSELARLETAFADFTAEDAQAAQSTRCLRVHRAILRALCGEVFYLTMIVPLI